ncbi:prolactin-like [Antennarius striatus]|uniref:prolactin-like n=1 Tax=Antennarius striatus TaxID=241820 RepID=UPI0035B0749F
MPGDSRVVRVVCVLVVCVCLCSRLTRVCGAPRCDNTQVGCHFLSLANLFDRVLQHSTRMHRISNELHAQLEQYFLSSKNQIGRVSRTCHTSTILTPNGKENAQRMGREELTAVILKLLQAWRGPLWHFHQTMAHHQSENNFSSSRALDMRDMVHELHKGVERLADKMRMLGISNSVSSAAVPETSPSDAAEWRLMTDYDLLYCFRRDSNKVQNYLKILKCRIAPENGC